MNFEQTLLLYLYQEKKVTLQEFGTIELTAAVPDPDVLKKEKFLPVEGLLFTHNRYAATDEAFIQFYAEQKGRIKSLATSDIEIHLIQAKQIVNIGNPYEIPGIGKIIKNDNGTLDIVPGYFIQPPALGSGRPATLKERDKEPTVPKTATTAPTSGSSRRMKQEKIKVYLLLAAAVLALGGIIWAFVTFVLPAITNQDQENNIETVSANLDTTATGSNASTTLTTPADSNLASATDSTTRFMWKAYIRKFTNPALAAEAQRRYQSYGMATVLETKDSNDFRIYLPIQAALSDTAFKRDSLRKWYARPVTLEKLNP